MKRVEKAMLTAFILSAVGFGVALVMGDMSKIIAMALLVFVYATAFVAT